MLFEEMKITKSLRRNLAEMGLTETTLIQQRAFPVAMSGRDVLGIAQTGTGKTIAYLLPCINMWKFTPNNPPQILILVPTRELVVQVLEVAKKLTADSSIKCVGVFGGVGMVPQAEAVREGADILVGTPGRLLDLILDGHVSMKNVKKLVVDEVDEMLEQGFRTQLGRVFDLLPKKRQNLLFSATLTGDIEKIVDTYFNVPERVEAAPMGTPLENIDQHLIHVPNFNTKINLLKYLLRKEEMTRVLVFVSSIALADKVFDRIEEEFGEDADYIHSKRTQSQRFRAVKEFGEGAMRVLIATDVVARGIDVSCVSHVINFDLPIEPEQYIHRIGRTGRADKQGISIAFCSPLEVDKLEEIETLMSNTKIPVDEMPADVEVSTVLTDAELPTYKMRNSFMETNAKAGSAFHEKSEKNKKTNHKVSHQTLMKQKYGKHYDPRK
ncbi:MAG: DEAD/DEAH box helicase [Bacteroidales bacterium]|nr:DEAD/DEAH box helicase [Bacteroidales bacterium]